MLPCTKQEVAHRLGVIMMCVRPHQGARLRANLVSTNYQPDVLRGRSIHGCQWSCLDNGACVATRYRPSERAKVRGICWARASIPDRDQVKPRAHDRTFVLSDTQSLVATQALLRNCDHWYRTFRTGHPLKEGWMRRRERWREGGVKPAYRE